MNLPLQQRFALAALLLETADAAGDPGAATAWDGEIRDRIQAIDNGTARGIPHEEVMREAERRLAR